MTDLEVLGEMLFLCEVKLRFSKYQSSFLSIIYDVHTAISKIELQSRFSINCVT